MERNCLVITGSEVRLLRIAALDDEDGFVRAPAAPALWNLQPATETRQPRASDIALCIRTFGFTIRMRINAAIIAEITTPLPGPLRMPQRMSEPVFGPNNAPLHGSCLVACD